MKEMHRGRTILLVENSSEDFFKSRLSYAKFLISEKWNVIVLVPIGKFVDEIQAHGIKLYTYSLNRNKSWVKQIIEIIGVYKRIFKAHNVEYVHSYRFLPNVVNVIANFFARRKKICHITGLGIAYSNSSVKYVFIRWVSNIIYFFLILFSDTVIVQNPDDIESLVLFPFMRKKIKLVLGSGVDTGYYLPLSADHEKLRERFGFKLNDKIFICVTRLIWEKGIRELIEAFIASYSTYPNIKLLIVGSPDTSNPRHVSEEYIKQFDKSELISFLGNRNDIKELLGASDVFVYPSYYREGIPRSLLEALSMRLPIITTDTPGCNLTVRPNVNGLLIAPRSVNAIADAVKQVTGFNEVLLEKMGNNSRELALSKFSSSVIYYELMKLYK